MKKKSRLDLEGELERANESIMLARGYFADLGIEYAFFDDVAMAAAHEIEVLRETVRALRKKAQRMKRAKLTWAGAFKTATRKAR